MRSTSLLFVTLWASVPSRLTVMPFTAGAPPADVRSLIYERGASGVPARGSVLDVL